MTTSVMTIRALLAYVVLATGTSFAVAQQEIKITASAGHAPVFLWVKHLKETFIPGVNAELAKTGKYKIVWTEAFGGTLAKIGSELETIEQGISDMGMVGGPFHTAKLPLQQVSYVTPFGPQDARMVTAVMNDLHQKIPALAKSYERYNQIYLAGISLDDYAAVTNFPLARLEDLNGRKLSGPPSALAWIKGSGAVGVSGNLPAYYNDIKSGVYQGAIAFATGAAPAKLYEVAPHFNQVGFGAMFVGGLTVNKNRWERFPSEVKAAFRAAGEEFTAEYHKEQFVRSVAALDTFRANKSVVTQWSDAERARLAKAIDNPTRAWAEQAEKLKFPAREVLRAYMAGVRAAGGKFARDWDKE
jgi:TRAP-type transport system periplasmic protein